MKNRRLLSLSLFCVSLVSLPLMVWAADASKPAPATAGKPGDAPSKSDMATVAASKRAYHLAVNDTINLDVVDDPKASLVQYKIEIDGTVRLKYLKEPIKLAGLTIDEAVAAVTKDYVDNQIFISPEISIQVHDYSDRKINVSGSVNSPKQVIIPPGEDATLVSVIAACNGPASIASRTVTITRKLAEGKTMTFKVDLLDAYNDGKKDVPLQDGDSLFLPQDNFGGVWNAGF